MSRNAKKGSARRGDTSRLRIIGGSWRGRSLSFVDATGLRPTGDRIRETLFNWLAGYTSGARVLDLFAGSGALALEALSRGAESATLVELNPRTVDNLRANIASLNCSCANVMRADALQFLRQGSPLPYDLVFLDPPFELALWQVTMEALDQGGWLRDGTLVYVESPRETLSTPPQGWQLEKQKVAGQVSFRLYRISRS